MIILSVNLLLLYPNVTAGFGMFNYLNDEHILHLKPA